MEFRGAAKRIDDLDLPRIGAMIGVGEDEVHAVLDVEAAGSGFDKNGRPKMLFEPHVFYRNLNGAQRDRAVSSGLAYAQWRQGAYPVDSYPRLIAAMDINETAALRAASWGLGQILGENHKAAGYATVQEMVRAFVDDEENHLLAMIRFIKTNKLDDDLRAHRWDTFANGYNGPRYAEHGYHTKLEARFNHWRRIRDTPYDPDAPAVVTAPVQPPAAPIPAPAPVVIEAPQSKPMGPPPAQPGWFDRLLASLRSGRK